MVSPCLWANELVCAGFVDAERRHRSHTGLHGSRVCGGPPTPARPTGATWGSSVEVHAQRVTSQLRDAECHLSHLPLRETWPSSSGQQTGLPSVPGETVSAAQSRSLETRSPRCHLCGSQQLRRSADDGWQHLRRIPVQRSPLFHTYLKFCLHHTIYPVLMPFVFSCLHLNFVLSSSLFSWLNSMGFCLFVPRA